MLKALSHLQKLWKAKNLPVLEIGIGINTAPVFVGNFGSKRQFNYTVIGDGVNLASRLEGLNKNYGTHLLISESTYHQVKEEFTCLLIDVVRVKGKQIPVKIYEPMLNEDLTENDHVRILQFHKILELYHRQDFGSAKKLLLGLQADDPKSRLFQVYLERIERFEKEPPKSDWDGVFTFTHK